MNTKPKYAGLGLALGAGLGAAFGVIAGHMGVWLAIGVAIGMVLGSTMRKKQPDCEECALLHTAHKPERGTK